MQIIILCESNSTAKTDYKYIKATIDQFFDVGKNRLSKIFLGTKSNYCKVEKQIQQLRKKYREVNPKARALSSNALILMTYGS
jgi:putative heme degradation protein